MFWKKPRIAEVEVQGNHGVSSTPPTKDLEHLVEAWLDELLRYSKADGPFRLQIECWRCPGAKSFYGVRAIAIAGFNPTSVELRVRPPRSQWQWRCHLLCPNPEMATRLIVRARTASAEFIARNVDWRTTQREQVDQGPAKQLQPRLERRLSETKNCLRLLRALGKRHTLLHLCASLAESIDEHGHLTASQVRRALSSALTPPIGLSSFGELMSNLVARGILDAESDEIFTPALLFEEYVETHRAQEVEEEAKRLELQEERLRKLLRGYERELGQIKERLGRLGQLITEVNEQIEDVVDSQTRSEAG